MFGLKKIKRNSMDKELDEAAQKWVFETNGHKWSNNDDTAGDNYGSFKEGANWHDERMYSDFIQFGKWLLLQDITSRGEGLYVDNKGELLTVEDLFEKYKKK
jgi:hypothetical protein